MHVYYYAAALSKLVYCIKYTKQLFNIVYGIELIDLILFLILLHFMIYHEMIS